MTLKRAATEQWDVRIIGHVSVHGKAHMGMFGAIIGLICLRGLANGRNSGR